ncbi:alpha/beta hydrolase fold domain-containing protein [Lacticaseibacillus saniviri]
MPRLKQAQTNTVSSEAISTLKTLKGFDIPNFIPITDKMIVRMRTQFQQGEDKIETDLIAKHHLTVTPIEFNGITGLKVTAPHTDLRAGAIMDVHGGGFIMGTARERMALIAAAETHLPVYSVEYTVAPEASAPIALNQVVDFYQGFLEAVGDVPTFMMGSSAGSNLVVASLLKAHAASIPMPSGIVIFCPAIDISGNGDSAVFNNKRDALTTHLSLRLAHRYIKDADPTSPEISPLYGEFGSWFPPTFMSTGTRDMMLSNVLRFTDKLQAVNVDVQSVIKEGMWHGFNWEETLPEAVTTRQAAWRFINQYSSQATEK